MTVFKDTRQLHTLMEDLWSYVIKETEVGSKLKEYDVNYKFIVNEPKGYLFVDSEKVLTGKEADQDAVITMELSGDTIHQFWLKEIKLPIALATRKIKSKGPVPKMLKMLPFLKAVHDLYPDFCEKHGVKA